ncbi:DUF47 family protein [Synechococcus sp. CCY9201]|uniref:DUF47 domain-containing protein n=1 Tax=unclassified Synechococcus TaxID=2626047 RepID=UPI001E6186E8|nr:MULTISPECIES: DUF47 family protein [unclassified Synechococcus]MEA5422204.1 DUF47 family protein [Synechococcus sp. CCY9202]MEA5473012.1 DUF47 family protein [Synechococcus sp. CCY9201]
MGLLARPLACFSTPDPRAVMSKETPQLFGKTRFLEGKIDEFLDKLSEGVIYFESGLLLLVERGVNDACDEKLQQMNDLKARCNEIRRSVVGTLYSEMLIPDFRGDVLSLLSDLYGLLDVIVDCYQEFMIEYPTVDKGAVEFLQELKNLLAVVTKSVQAAIMAARAFFRNPSAVRDHIYEIRVYESEADRSAIRLKRMIFSSSLSLVQKLHVRDAVDAIDGIADLAEDVSDELSIYAIKRAL